MKRTWAYLLAVLALVLVCGCSRHGRVLSREKMADIYYDMFMLDTWLQNAPSARKAADTSLVYEPIFRKHGCSFKDYDASVNHYLSDPDTYKKIFDDVYSRLKVREKELEAEVKRLEDIKEFENSLPPYTPHDFDTLKIRLNEFYELFGKVRLFPVS